MEETFDIGVLTERPEFNDHFVRISYNEDLKFFDEKIFKIIDGKEEIFDFKFVVSCNFHQILFTSFLSLNDLSAARISLEEICNRADKHNKLVVGYLGKNSLNEKYYIVQCKICGYVAKQYMRSFNYCNGCNPNSLKSSEDFISESIIIHEDKYNYSDVEYTGVMKKVKIFCRKCEKYFFQIANDHLRGHGCPNCNESKGELRVAKYLNKNNIKFAKNKGFDGLRDKGPLKFDFYIREINGLVEYDGEGHYFGCFGSTPEEKQKNLEDCQRRDKIKNEWAKANNIPLLRIPYWDFHRIPELIEAFILEHKKLVLEI
jgi:Zn finger protein HypA/HybF involved in hydrogenase expression